MKKIIFTVVTLFVAVAINAQTGRGTPNKKTEPNNDPLVNGIPYSQYKAQQNALKQQQTQAAAQPVTTAKPGMITTSTEPVAAPVPSPVTVSRADAKTEVKLAQPVVELKAAPTEQAKPKGN